VIHQRAHYRRRALERVLEVRVDSLPIAFTLPGTRHAYFAPALVVKAPVDGNAGCLGGILAEVEFPRLRLFRQHLQVLVLLDRLYTISQKSAP